MLFFQQQARNKIVEKLDNTNGWKECGAKVTHEV